MKEMGNFQLTKMTFNFSTAFKILALIYILIFPIFGNDDYFQFLDQSLPEKIEYEKSRKLCLFPFRNKAEAEKFQYLSNGIPSVIISNLNGFKYVFDSEVLETVVYHAYGDKNNIPPPKKGKPIVNSKTLKELNSGEKQLLPEKDPRYIKLDTSLIPMESAPFLESNLEIGRKNNCFYIITGEFIINGEDSLTINLEFTYRKNGKVDTFSEETSIRRAYQEMNAMGIKIKKLLFSKEMATIKIEVGEESDALVFIDGHYAGKTPLEKSDIAAGRHSVSITKEGHETLNRVVNLKENTVSKYSFSLKKLEKKGLLSVKSNPPGASVYLGITYLGETPLNNVVVPLGQNRIRIEKADHIDHYSGVEVEAGKPFNVDVKLKEGKTEDYYKNRLKLFLDYTYFDFSQYSVYSVVLFYASFQYWNYRINVQRDSIRGDTVGRVMGDLSLINNFQSRSQPEIFWGLLDQYNQVNSSERTVLRFRGYRNASAAGAVTMLFLSGVFYYLGVDTDAFEFAISPSLPSITNPDNSIETQVKINFRF